MAAPTSTRSAHDVRDADRRHPGVCGDAQEVAMKKLAGEMRSLSVVAPNAPAPLIELVHKLLESEPAKRPPSATDVIARLDGTAHNPTVAAQVLPPKHRWVAAVCGVATRDRRRVRLVGRRADARADPFALRTGPGRTPRGRDRAHRAAARVARACAAAVARARSARALAAGRRARRRRLAAALRRRARARSRRCPSYADASAYVVAARFTMGEAPPRRQRDLDLALRRRCARAPAHRDRARHRRDDDRAALARR